MTIRVKLSELVARADLYVRCAYDESRVEEFVELLQDNRASLPPIQAILDHKAHNYWIVDGVHRYFAWKKLGAEEVSVDILGVPEGEDPQRYAVLHAIAQTATGPLSPTQTDRRRFCDLIIEHCPEMTDAEVARRCGMSRQGVWRRRNHTEPDRNETSEASAPRTSPGADVVATRLVRDLGRLEDARGLRDLAAPSRMGHHLARALSETHGEGAASCAKRYLHWFEGALDELEDSA